MARKGTKKNNPLVGLAALVIIIVLLVGSCSGGKDNKTTDEPENDTASATESQYNDYGYNANIDRTEFNEDELVILDEILDLLQTRTRRGWSKEDIINHFETRGSMLGNQYSREELEPVLDRIDIDYCTEALYSLRFWRTEGGIDNKTEMRETLKEKGFTDEQIDYAFDNYNGTLEE